MTIAIAIALKTRVILVRTGQPCVGDEQGAQASLTVLRDNLVVSVLGDGGQADAAVETLLRADAALDSGEQVQTRIADCVDSARRAPHDVNHSIPGTDVQLIAAGIDGGGSYIAGALHGAQTTGADSMLRRPWRGTPTFILLGREAASASGYFEGLLRQYKLAGLTDDAVAETLLLSAARRTAAMAAESSPHSGGETTFHILRANLPPRSGVLS